MKNKFNKDISVRCIVCDDFFFQRIFIKKAKAFYRCSKCSFEMQFPLPSKDDVLNYYNESYRVGLYKKYLQASEMRQIAAEYRLTKILPYIRRGKLLDVGCSDGTFIQAAIKKGFEVEGIDIAPIAIKQANQLGLRAYCKDLQNYSPPYLFETITCFDVLEHSLNPDGFILSAKKLLKPEGTLILSTPNRRSIFRLFMKKRWYFYIPDEHIFYFDPQTIKKFLTRKGFQIIKCGRIAKSLTIEYGLTRFEEYNPLIHKMLTIITAILPKTLLQRSIPFYIGEMIIIAKNSN